ncbi:MAG: phage integrase N-terminal SAM-like domain-containing protein [bacterium]
MVKTNVLINFGNILFLSFMLNSKNAVLYNMLTMEKSHTQQSDPNPPKLLDEVRTEISLRHFSYRTEQTYIHWIRRFILHLGKRHPREMGAVEVNKTGAVVVVINKHSRSWATMEMK